MKTVLIRADSSSDIGTGHIMRDLVLAKQFPDARVIFATRPLEGNIANRIDEAGYDVVWLNTMALDELTEVIKKNQVDTLVIDHYGIGHEEEKVLKKHTGATIFVLDDTYEQHYCDILLNHNVYADPGRYKGLVPSHCELRCGKKYTLLRKEFALAKKNISNRPSAPPWNVLIIMGGVDHLSQNIPILEVLKDFDIFPHVVTSSANRHLDQLLEYVSAHKRVTLHLDSRYIADLMACSHLAIATPSVTMNELLFMGVPIIGIQTASNQAEMSVHLEHIGQHLLRYFSTEGLMTILQLFFKKR